LVDRIILPDRDFIQGPEGEKRVAPKAIQVLHYLAVRGGEVVTRQKLLDHTWKDTYSGDEALTRCISLLRSALGESRSGHKFIETVPKTGYRLAAPVVVLHGDFHSPLESKLTSPAQEEITGASPAQAARIFALYCYQEGL